MKKIFFLIVALIPMISFANTGTSGEKSLLTILGEPGIIVFELVVLFYIFIIARNYKKGHQHA